MIRFIILILLLSNNVFAITYLSCTDINKNIFNPKLILTINEDKIVSTNNKASKSEIISTRRIKDQIFINYKNIHTKKSYSFICRYLEETEYIKQATDREDLKTFNLNLNHSIHNYYKAGIMNYFSNYLSYNEPSNKSALLELLPKKKIRARQYMPREFNMLVWNIYKGINPQLEYELPELLEDTHLALLQEVQLNPMVKETLTSSEKTYNLAVSFSKNKIPTGVATGSNIKIKTSRYQRTLQRELGFTTPKSTLFTTYDILNKKEDLLVVNVHAINFVFNKLFSDQMNDLFKVVTEHLGPVVFAGDFNTWTSYKYHYLKNKMTEHGFLETKFKNDARKKAPYLSNFDSFNYPLDNIFVRGIEILEAEVFEEYKGSDHNPLYLRLRIK